MLEAKPTGDKQISSVNILRRYMKWSSLVVDGINKFRNRTYTDE